MGIYTECPAPAPPPPPLLNFDHDPPSSCSLLLLLLLILPPVTAQFQYSPPPPLDPFAKLRFDRTMAVVLVILVLVFFTLGFVSIYTRQCAERRIRGRLDLAVAIASGSERRPSRGLESAIIDTFPIFVYSEVKGLKIGKATLECAVCLNEFRDDETLRLIPKCSHVFHPDCIDTWLLNHNTCPVCRANLVPKPSDTAFSVAVQILDPGGPEPNISVPQPGYDPNWINPVDGNDGNMIIMNETHSVNLDDENRPVRSRSTGFEIRTLFPRSYSTGHSLVQLGENCERFTLRLPEEVRNRLVSSASATLDRTKSCSVTWHHENSGRSGYRTRSVGRNYLHYERLDRWGFMWTPPILGRAGPVRSTKDSKAIGVMDEAHVGERSSDRLFSKH
ncbi:RING-H2 finger protein ATL11-like [Abrus precatorius]|uniref:RING-type E3 ubiquitin transferase n=1 Tax=Abrus precatorius TaxID=3816 RepID=A0A8B8MI55_ABRPR|nr:RING-H2 finger protein ATL11-like [Abrus precatorius]